METKKVTYNCNPGRIGFFTGRSMERGRKALLQIRFPDATQYYPDNELEEIISQGKQHPLDLLSEGRIGRATRPPPPINPC